MTDHPPSNTDCAWSDGKCPTPNGCRVAGRCEAKARGLVEDHPPSKDRLAELIADYQLRYDNRDCKCDTSDETVCKCCRGVCVCHFDFDTIAALKLVYAADDELESLRAIVAVWRQNIERQAAQIATLKGYIERTAVAGYRCAECAERLTAEPAAEHGGRIMTLAECVEAEGGIPFQAMEPNTDPLTHMEILSAVHHHANEIVRLTAAVPVECSPQPPRDGQ